MESKTGWEHDHLEYPPKTMFDLVEAAAHEHPKAPAYDFYGKKTSYEKMLSRITRAARALAAAGVKKNDIVTICMPNSPQAIDCIYALNMLGAAANMVHPLSAEEEIARYLEISGSRILLTLDLFYEKAEAARAKAGHPVTLLIARMQNELPPAYALLYILKKGKDYLKFPDKPDAILWSDFLKKGDAAAEPERAGYEEGRTAVILYSGGTSGIPKGICLTDMNINACAMQAREAIQLEYRDGLKMLSCMPFFHGFGLAINMHIVLIHGAGCILMPTFNNKSYAHMLKKKKPNFIAGVPTIFDALLHNKELENADLSFLEGIFCGGDSLPVELKRKVDAFLNAHGAHIQIREGYGLTECVTASCLTPRFEYREGSIGIPFPDTFYAIVEPGTANFLPPGESGEIILRGPTVMPGYLNNEKETKAALRTLPDGNTWLYTGDIGKIDEDGYVYFIQRSKRIIITNGYNVYPSQIENALDSLDEVENSCVIGVKDPRRMQRVRAYIVLKEGVSDLDAAKEKIMRQLGKKIAAYALPRDIIFRKELPMTLIGKINYHALEEEASNEAPEEN